MLIPACNIDTVLGSDTGVNKVRDTEALTVLGSSSSGSSYLEEIGLDTLRLQNLTVDSLGTGGPLGTKVVDGPVLGAVAEIDEKVWLVSDLEADDLGAILGSSDVLESSLSLVDDTLDCITTSVGEIETVSDGSAIGEVVHGSEVVGTKLVVVGWPRVSRTGS